MTASRRPYRMVFSEFGGCVACRDADHHNSLRHGENEVTIFECYPLAADRGGVFLGGNLGRCADRGEVEGERVPGHLDGFSFRFAGGDEHHVGTACSGEVNGEAGAVR